MQKILLLMSLFLSLGVMAEVNTSDLAQEVPATVGGYKNGVITLNDKNTLSLNSQVDGESMGKLMGDLSELNKIDTNEPIFLVLSTPGGEVYSGLDFIRYAKTSRRPVHTITLFAASMGFQIVESLGSRYMVSYSTLMSHRVKSSGGGTVEIPGSADTRYAHLLSHIKEQDSIVIARTKGKFNEKTYAELIANEYWANADRAINDGFADEKVTVICDKSLEGSNTKLFNMMLYSVNVEFSKCPMITIPLSVKPANNLEYIEKNNINVTKEFHKTFGN